MYGACSDPGRIKPTTTRSVGGHSIQLNYWTARMPYTVAFTKNYIYSPHSRSAGCTFTTYCVWLHSDRNSISTRIHIRYQRLCVIVCATLIPLTLPSSVLPSTYMMHPQALAPCFFKHFQYTYAILHVHPVLELHSIPSHHHTHHNRRLVRASSTEEFRTLVKSVAENICKSRHGKRVHKWHRH